MTISISNYHNGIQLKFKRMSAVKASQELRDILGPGEAAGLIGAFGYDVEVFKYFTHLGWIYLERKITTSDIGGVIIGYLAGRGWQVVEVVA